MFNIGCGELILVLVIGLVVLGPRSLSVAIRTLAGWIKAIQYAASTVHNEFTQELKLQESLTKVEEASKNKLSPELTVFMEELRGATESMKKDFNSIDSTALDSSKSHAIHNQLVTDPKTLHDSVIP